LLLKTRARQQLETFGQPLDLFFFGLVNIELGLVVHGLLQFSILTLGRNLWLFEMSHAGIWEIILVEMQFNLVMVAVGNESTVCELCQSIFWVCIQ
jgi:hypothetical protein